MHRDLKQRILLFILLCDCELSKQNIVTSVITIVSLDIVTLRNKQTKLKRGVLTFPI